MKQQNRALTIWLRLKFRNSNFEIKGSNGEIGKKTANSGIDYMLRLKIRNSIFEIKDS